MIEGFTTLVYGLWSLWDEFENEQKEEPKPEGDDEAYIPEPLAPPNKKLPMYQITRRAGNIRNVVAPQQGDTPEPVGDEP